MILKAFIVIVVSYFAVSAFAEYRAFELRIEKTDNPENFRTVISSLDPVQYRGYYPVQRDEVVYYTKTWMCRGRTGNFNPICQAPGEAEGDQTGAPIAATAAANAPFPIEAAQTSVENIATP